MKERQKITRFNGISKWLSNSVSESEDKRYTHRLLREDKSQRDIILNELILIVQKAHEDARYRLRKLAGNSLAPFGDFSESDPSYGYPERLNIISRQGYFGEIFSGIIAENFAPFGQDDWEVPAFLFRFHLVEFQHLEFLSQTNEIAKKRPGRTGDDCLAFLRNSEGVIIASLVCEAKCTTNHYTKMIAEAHEKASEPHIKPVDIPQIIEVLGDYDDPFSSEWVNSLRVLWLGSVDKNYERCDLISYICGKHPVINPTWISPDKPHEQYTAGRRLEAVEIHLHEVENLVITVYSQPASATPSVHISTQTVQQPDDSEFAFATSDVIVEGEVLQNEMTQPSNEVIALAAELQNSLAGSRLTPAIAKLYSQHTRLRAGGKGLTGWREDEAGERLNDAMRLIEAAFIQREAGDTNWLNGMLRAAELFEWLSHPQLNPDILPIRLLAAAVYELAGYPARAAGLLNEDTSEGVESEILRSLLKADFPSLLQRLTEYWATATSSNLQSETSLLWDNTDTDADRFNKLIVKETASSLGILCAKMRWGNEPRLEKAIEKLSAIAKVLLHGHNTYSWLLGKLCAEVASVYIETSLRHHLEALSQMITQSGKTFLERYLRQSYQNRKALAWRSQICGIERLATIESFALCTPTGSGKTTIAEIAILQSLFLETKNYNNFSSSAPLVMYLVPSRALATEVESNLSRVLKRSTNNNVIITGLYGGTDWGPTDVWLTSEKPTVLICTYEKAEALIKFLGSLFIRRVSLIVLDEAHAVQFDGNKNSLQKAENRSLRLESLGARLFTYIEQNHSRIIALSAVASETEVALANWIENQTNASPAKTYYRSTRQLIGRLECLPGRRFEIRYDLLDGRRLEFEEGGKADTPFIPRPFEAYHPAPKWEKEGPEKRLRPYLFWAAMHLAAPDEKGQRRAVLISVTQQIGGYAEDFLKLLNSTWSKVEKPSFFKDPSVLQFNNVPIKFWTILLDTDCLAGILFLGSKNYNIWQKCLRSCEDYFGTESREYKLLKKGIIVHHGKMPGLMARLLIDVIDEKIVHLVLATSTLSEGVNLPFETVLIPSLRRGKGELNIREFGNLVGRSGRPGFGTEGRSLVLLSNPSTDWSDKEARKRYLSLIGELENQTQAINPNANPLSPLAELLLRLEEQWQLISSSNRQDNFLTWLEKTAPIDCGNNLSDAQLSAIETLDSLDSILLSAIVEIEQLAAEDLSPNELEEQLQKIWQRSFAHYASREQERLENLFISRGVALKTEIYKDLSQRRCLYRTSLPPRDGNQLLTLYPRLKEQLAVGGDYAIWTVEERFNYIQNTVSILTSLSKFKLIDPSGKVTWNEILRWWLDPTKAIKKPKPTQISNWHSYISQNFGYRFNWGLGSVIALAIDEAFGGELVESSLENWSQTGLPWIVFWMKELIVWGTLDPIAAYLLAKVEDVTTRKQAEELAQTYYQYISERETEANEHLNAINIKNWVEQSFSSVERHLPTLKPPNQINVNLLRDFSKAPSKNWRVVPVEIGDDIQWFDLAGFPLAICQKPEKWQSDFLNTYDFMLDAENRFVSSKIYV
ncbi:DEAD/DEAH box helicase [Nostoc sp.]|uniref:DEAD/DEAH box helicase n=1 Tax=Nostoc sp. TaxID=1180 RepID=UPI002FF6C07F